MFYNKNSAVSIRGRWWLSVLFRLTKPSVRFIADVLPCDGAHCIASPTSSSISLLSPRFSQASRAWRASRQPNRQMGLMRQVDDASEANGAHLSQAISVAGRKQVRGHPPARPSWSGFPVSERFCTLPATGFWPLLKTPSGCGTRSKRSCQPLMPLSLSWLKGSTSRDSSQP
jgi:hypothetical protein